MEATHLKLHTIGKKLTLNYNLNEIFQSFVNSPFMYYISKITLQYNLYSFDKRFYKNNFDI